MPTCTRHAQPLYRPATSLSSLAFLFSRSHTLIKQPSILLQSLASMSTEPNATNEASASAPEPAPAPAPVSRKRTSTGRRKIPMQKIEKKEALQVSFSKRRQGLFKKASEISILCGVQIAAIVFSPGGKAYSFGNPSVDAVIDRYLSHCLLPSTSSSSYNATHDHMQLVVLDQQRFGQLNDLPGNTQALTSSSSSLTTNWWDEELIEQMGIQELQAFYQKLVAFRKLAVKMLDD